MRRTSRPESLDEFRTFSGDREEFITYNRAFHTALAHASGNRRMAAALCDLIGQADRLVRVSIANVRDTIRRSWSPSMSN